jgi:hypothetical protein
MKKILSYFLNKYKFVRGDLNQNNRIGMLHKCWGHVFSNHLYGDYVEFGVYHGDSFLESIKQFKEFKNWLAGQKSSSEKWRIEIASKSPLNQKVYFHGLDTFDGMPENNEKNFIFHEKSFLGSYEKVLNRIEKINFKDFYLYKGRFNEQKKEIFNNLKDRKISITNIDCDLYSSTVDSFNIIENFLQIGSIILLDDYNSFNADNLKGQRKALNEYKEKTKWIIEPFF